MMRLAAIGAEHVSGSASVELIVEVIGTPAPQGSKSSKGFRAGRPVLVESCTGVKPWREAVVRATTKAMTTAGFTTILTPSTVVIEFYLTRPASTPKHRTRPHRRPDLDKHIRSTLDALTTAGAFEDDARVVHIEASKHHAEGPAGARIVVHAAGTASYASSAPPAVGELVNRRPAAVGTAQDDSATGC